jgi:hypothetical protein
MNTAKTNLDRSRGAKIKSRGFRVEWGWIDLCFEKLALVTVSGAG